MEKKKELINFGILDEPYDCFSNAASSMDCTGCVPVAPQTQAQQDAYDEVVHFKPHSVHKETEKPDTFL